METPGSKERKRGDTPIYVTPRNHSDLFLRKKGAKKETHRNATKREGRRVRRTKEGTTQRKCLLDA